VDFVNEGGGKSLKMLKVEATVLFSVFGPHFYSGSASATIMGPPDLDSLPLRLLHIYYIHRYEAIFP